MESASLLNNPPEQSQVVVTQERNERISMVPERDVPPTVNVIPLDVDAIDQESNTEALPAQEEANDTPRVGFGRIFGASRLWKRGVICEAVWFTIVNCALIVALIVDKDGSKQCEETQLKKWATLEIFLQTLMGATNCFIQYRLPRSNRGQMRERRLQTLASFYIISRFFNIVWIIWAILGIVWTFQVDGKCSTAMPVLYTLCFVLAVFHLVLLGLPVLLCCCSIPGMIVAYWLCPSFYGKKPSKKATMKLIKKKTKLQKYKEDLVDKEDASCAICLSEYQPSEEIRFLPCKHHFHSDCIVQWLMTNKSCPFCKLNIDEESEKNDKEAAPLIEEEVQISVPPEAVEQPVESAESQV